MVTSRTGQREHSRLKLLRASARTSSRCNHNTGRSTPLAGRWWEPHWRAGPVRLSVIKQHNAQRGALRWSGKHAAIVGVAAPLFVPPCPPPPRTAPATMRVTQSRGRVRLQRGARIDRHLFGRQRAGLSPTSAGNVRIDGLYFDPQFTLTSIVSGMLEHQGRPVGAGLSIRRRPAASSTTRCAAPRPNPPPRSCSTAMPMAASGWRSTARSPSPATSSLGYGLTANHVEFPDGTDNWNHAQGLLARWTPAPGVEILPFWTLSPTTIMTRPGPSTSPAARTSRPSPRAPVRRPGLGRFPLQRDQPRRARLSRAGQGLGWSVSAPSARCSTRRPAMPICSSTCSPTVPPTA